MSQAFDHKWPVVSVKTGAGGAKRDIKQAIEWLEAFDSVVFMFDNDDVGQKAALECAALLSPRKAKIAKLPLKDASESSSWHAGHLPPRPSHSRDPSIWVRQSDSRRQTERTATSGRRGGPGKHHLQLSWVFPQRNAPSDDE